MSFLFLAVLLGVVIATLQDIKRKEVDNWLNLLILFVGSAYLFFKGIGSESFFSLLILLACLLGTSFLYFHTFNFKQPLTKIKEYLFSLGLLVVAVVCFFLILAYYPLLGATSLYLLFSLGLLAMFVLSNLFYYGRVFAGGDSKLLFALTPFFISLTLKMTLSNILIFAFLLMLAGSVYGLLYSLALYTKNFSRANKNICKEYRKHNKWYFLLSFIALCLLGFYHPLSFLLAGLFLLFILLFLFARGLEGVSMIKTISGKQLQEGDWLAHDVRIGKKLIKADWNGLTKKELAILKKKKKVTIKEGFAFVPAFLIAYLLYFLFREHILGYLTFLY